MKECYYNFSNQYLPYFAISISSYVPIESHAFHSPTPFIETSQVIVVTNELRKTMECFLAFNAAFDTKHGQPLIKKDFSNFCGKDIETDSLPLFLRLCWLWEGYYLFSYRFLYVKSLVFYGHLFSNSDLIPATYAFFVIREQLFVCDSRTRALSKGISRSKSRLWQLSFRHRAPDR